MKLVLFDIDGTLINTRGVGSRAFGRALKSVLGAEDGLMGVRLDGQTDPLILKRVLELRGIAECSSEQTHQIYRSYLDYLAQELEVCDEQYEVLPGVEELLTTLAADRDFVVGLATGNIEAGARMKLERGGLNRFFAFGGFGSDAEDRTELIRTAIERARERVSPAGIDAVFVIGDTPKDIFHGLEAGARVIAVATGFYSLSELESFGPSWALKDLTGLDGLLRILGGRAPVE